MSDTPQNNDLRPLLIIIAVIVVALVALQIVSMIVSLLLVLTIAAALYFGATTGYKLAMNSEVWENRRITKHHKLQAARLKEKEYFKSQDQEWMEGVLDNHYDDEQRELYKKKDRFQEAAKTVKKVKDIFR